MMKSLNLLVIFLVGSLCLSLPDAYGQSYKSYGSLGRFYIPKSYRPSTPPPRTYKYESQNWSVRGYSKYQYKYKSGGRTYKGTIETFPSGAVRHKGRWK